MNARSSVAAALAVLALAACRPTSDARTTSAATSGGASSGASASVEARPPPGTEASVASACLSAPEINFGATVRGVTVSRGDRFHATCGFGAASGDAVYRFHLDRPARVVAKLEARHDTVLSLRRACWDETTELFCNDDDPRGGTNSTIDALVPAGDYTLVVDGFGTDANGSFALRVDAEIVDRAPPLAPSIARVAEGEGVTVTRREGSSAVSGSAQFAKRTFTERGLSRAVRWVAAPHARIEAVAEDGSVLVHSETDDRGAFSLDLPRGRAVRVKLLSRTTLLGSDLRVVTDPGTERTIELSTRPFVVQGGEVIEFRAGTGGAEPAGAFNILANFVRYLPIVHRAFERVPPPLFAFWRRGNNAALPQGSITAFLGAYARHSGSYALQIQGGDEGREDASDSDQFDDPVVLHEFSHYVVGTMAGHFSLGGNHPGGSLYFPALAMDEGFANALGCAVAGSSHYWDTAGLEPEEPLARSRQHVLIDEDMERLSTNLLGNGSQIVAQALLWDLIDGADGIDDRDNDGVAIGVGEALRVYRSFREGDGPPAMNSFLERAVSLGVVTDAQARAIVQQPARLGFSYPVTPAERWPEELALGTEHRGRVDGRSQPAPSGGRNHLYNGLDASRTYLLRVPTRARVTIELVIDGPGTDASDTDLDLVLATRDLRSIATSATFERTERIERELEPGQYVVMVRDGDLGAAESSRPGGNRATFTLRAR